MYMCDTLITFTYSITIILCHILPMFILYMKKVKPITERLHNQLINCFIFKHKTLFPKTSQMQKEDNQKSLILQIIENQSKLNSPKNDLVTTPDITFPNSPFDIPQKSDIIQLVVLYTIWQNIPERSPLQPFAPSSYLELRNETRVLSDQKQNKKRKQYSSEILLYDMS